MESSQADGISGHRHHLAAVPHPGRGHINPMLNLCRLLASRGLLVTVVVTEEWFGMLSSDRCTPRHPNLRLAAIPNVIPPERMRGVDFRVFMQAVYTKMESPVNALLVRLEPPVDAIIADSILPWAANILKQRNVSVSAVWTMSAAVLLDLHQFGCLDADEQSAVEVSGKGNPPLDYIPRASNFFSRDSNQDIIRRFIQNISWYNSAKSLLLTSFYELENHAIDTLRSKLPLSIYPLGPSIPYMALDEGTAESDIPYHYKWLDSQPRRSVLYISLGSFVPISSTQMEEMVMGIQASSVCFFWIMRGEPNYLQVLSKDNGLIVPWCDQLRVLCHPSIGGFLTHCGWNSTLEGIYAGVPILTFPLIFDQYPNSKLIVDEWKVGLRLKNEEAEESVVGREKITEIIQKIMDLFADESKELRRRMRELKEKCYRAQHGGGSLSANLDAFVQDVVQCHYS